MPQNWTLGHRPALDGLRTYAVAIVLIAHAGTPGAGILGGAGVTVFFTLSGFLITALLLEERAQTGRPRLGKFYRRRATRLTPALAACIATGIALQVALTGRANWEQALAGITYTMNLYVPTQGAWPNGPYNHTWSLAIEEQFYLLWPLTLLALARLSRTATMLILAQLVAWSLALRIVTHEPGTVGHSHVSLATRADELLIGAIVAVAMHGRPAKPWSPRLVAPLLVAIVAAGIWVPALLMPTVVALLSAVVVRVAATAPVPLLSGAVVVWLGRRSYGIYLFNTPVFWGLAFTGWPWWVAGPIGLGLTVVAAAASFRWLEAPLMRRLGSAAPNVPSALGARRVYVHRLPLPPSRSLPGALGKRGR